MKELDHILLLTMEVYFYSHLTVLSLWFDKNDDDHNNVLFFLCFHYYYFFYISDAAHFFLASSICLCHNASFISNLHNKKKFKSEHVFMS